MCVQPSCIPSAPRSNQGEGKRELENGEGMEKKDDDDGKDERHGKIYGKDEGGKGNRKRERVKELKGSKKRERVRE